MTSVMEWTIPAIGVRPPFLIFAAVRAIAPVAGIPPKRAEGNISRTLSDEFHIGAVLSINHAVSNYTGEQ